MCILFLSSTKKKMLYEHSVEAKLVYLTMNKKKMKKDLQFFVSSKFYNNFCFSVDETKYISTPCIQCNYTVPFLDFVVADGLKKTQLIIQNVRR